jgi:hypothetical protein
MQWAELIDEWASLRGRQGQRASSVLWRHKLKKIKYTVVRYRYRECGNQEPGTSIPRKYGT